MKQLSLWLYYLKISYSVTSQTMLCFSCSELKRASNLLHLLILVSQSVKQAVCLLLTRLGEKTLNLFGLSLTLNKNSLEEC